MASAFLAAYWTVLAAELIGDKSIYTVASLASRFRAALVFMGIALAFSGKMLAAVLLGHAVLSVSSRWTMLLSAAVFFSVAAALWRRRPGKLELDAGSSWPRAAATSFASLFFTEWGDPGQIAAAALAANSHLPGAIWLGGTLAMLTKGVFAMTLGVSLRDRIPEKTMRVVASASCCLLGVIALCEALAA